MEEKQLKKILIFVNYLKDNVNCRLGIEDIYGV
jgi:hypothetical protein